MLLITTAESSFRHLSKDVVYLGEWCLPYPHDSSNSSELNILPYHWDDRTKYNHDYSYLDSTYEYYLSELSARLDKIHDLSNGPTYWRIVIGPWLRFFIDILFDRFECIRTAAVSDVVTHTLISNITSLISSLRILINSTPT